MKCVLKYLIVGFVFCAGWFSAQAETATVDGYTWTYEDYPNHDDWVRVTAVSGAGNATSIKIPDKLNGKSVAELANDVFKSYSKLESVKLPSSLVTISDHAFDQCRSLTGIDLPEGLKSITRFAFQGSGLKHVKLPSTLTWLGGSVFKDCSDLESFECDEQKANFNIYQYVLANCTKLSSVKLGEGIEWIEENAFAGCTALQTIDIPSTVTNIQNNAFRNCSNLRTAHVYAPRDEITIEEGAFPATTRIVYIGDYEYVQNGNGYTITKGRHQNGALSVPETIKGLPVTALGDGAFAETGITSLTLDDRITDLGANVFSGCTKLKTVVLNKHISAIDESAFRGCTALTSVTFKGKLQYVADSAFNGCTSLAQIEIPARDNYRLLIGASAFDGCSKLKNATLYAPQKGVWAVVLGASAFPSGCQIVYSAINYRTETDGTVTILGVTTGNNGYASDLVIPQTICGDTVTTLGDGAFRMEGLTSVTLPGTVTTIGDSAFYGCSLLTNVVLSANLRTIGAYAFFGCKSLTSIHIPASVTTIGKCAFYNSALAAAMSYTTNPDNSVKLASVTPAGAAEPIAVSGVTTFTSAEKLDIINSAMTLALADYPETKSVAITAQTSGSAPKVRTMSRVAQAGGEAADPEVAKAVELALDLGVEPTAVYEEVNGVLTLTFILPTIEITRFDVVQKNGSSIGTIGVKVVPAAGTKISVQANTESVKGVIRVFGTPSLDQGYTALPDITFDLTPYLNADPPGSMTLTVDLGTTCKFFKVKAGNAATP